MIGQHAEAMRLLREARDASRRPPAALEALILRTAIDSGRHAGEVWQRWPTWRQVSMVWRGHLSSVLLGLVVHLQLLEQVDPDLAQELAYRASQLPSQLTARLRATDFGLAEHQRARFVQAMALELAAHIYSSRGQHADAALAYTDAHHEFASVRDRARACRALIRVFTSALAAGYSEPADESHALEMIRACLHLLEEDRGTLRGDEGRASWIASQRELYATVFTALVSIRYSRAQAGELGLWLLESLHRTSTATLIRDAAALDSDPELLATLATLARHEYDARMPGLTGTAGPQAPQADVALTALRRRVRATLGAVRETSLIAESTDVEAALHRLGDRVALLYHCWREEAGWVVHGVLASARHGIRVWRERLPPALPMAVLAAR